MKGRWKMFFNKLLTRTVASIMVFVMLIFTTSCATSSVKRTSKTTGDVVEEKYEKSDSNHKFIESVVSILLAGVVICAIFLAAGSAGYYDQPNNK